MTDNIIAKTCTKCEKNLPTSEFNKHKYGRDGLKAQCKGCDKAYNDARTESLSSQPRTQVSKDCTKCGTFLPPSEFSKDKSKRDGLKPQCKGCRKDYREAHSEEIAEYNRAYYEANPEEIAERTRNWRKANPDKCRAHSRNRRARKRNAEGSHTAEQVQARFAVHGNKCIYCGSPDSLQVEHIKPLEKGGSNWASNLAPACAKCNKSKYDRWGADLLRWLEQKCTVARTKKILENLLHSAA